MFDAVSSAEHLLRFAILSIPVLVLLVLFFLLRSNATVTRRDQPPAVEDDALSATSSQAAAQAGRDTLGIMGAAPPLAGEAASADAASALDELEAQLAGAEQAGEPVALAHIYLALGRARIRAGVESQALDALRSCAGLAALHKAGKLHAEARIELAEAAYRAGDLTSACEHWQMARMAFLDDGLKADGDRIDRRMRANGCPTDWVLTDF